MSDRAVASLGSMRDPESADAVGHARGGCPAKQHRRAAGQAGAFACQIHWQPGRDKLAVTSVATTDREQSHSTGFTAAHQQRHLQRYQHQAAFNLQFSTAFSQ